MENLLNVISGMDVGMTLLFGFWATCLIGFVSVVGYVIVMGVHSFIMKNINKVRSHYIKI
jgi:hypothetical protein